MNKLFDQFVVDDYSAATGGSRSEPPSHGEKPVVIGVNADGTAKTARYPGAYTSDRPTPYDQSSLGQSDYEAEARKEFFGDTRPHYEIKRQKPEHLVMLYMKAEGRQNKEIAEAMGCSAVTVANVLKQAWARKQLKEIIANAGGNQVVALFKGAAADAAQLLIDQMESEDERVAQSAADKILDRAFGKASQPLSVTYSDEDLKKGVSDEELLKLACGN